MIHPSVTLQELKTLISAMKMQFGTPTNSIPFVTMKPIQAVLTEKAAICAHGGPMPFLMKAASDKTVELKEMEERHEILTAPIIPRMFMETEDVEKAVAFYKNAFGAKEFSFGFERILPNISAELNLRGIQINIYERRYNLNTKDEIVQAVLFGNAYAEKRAHTLLFWDADEAAAKAVGAGAAVVQEAMESDDERLWVIRDPCGYLWYLSSPARNPSLDRILSLKRVIERMFYY